jgi:hypothetical protein
VAFFFLYSPLLIRRFQRGASASSWRTYRRTNMASVAIQFKKAVKYDARGRVALVGPAGSGKSYTGLKLARLLAGPNGRIAALDTEHGSLSKYADLFDFDVFELASYSPDRFMAALDAAEADKYDVLLVDSLSHFWVGKDGALEFVDAAARRHKDQMGGWKDFRPHERAMVDRMIASPCHVIVTMRTKTEYVEEINPNNGKKQRKKVGLQPVQREGLEYEFDLVGYMDEDNTFIVDKTRCSAYAAKAITKPSEKDFQTFCDWLKGAKRIQESAQKGIHAIPTPSPWRPAFEELEQSIGRQPYLRALGVEGFTGLDEITDRDTASRVYKAVLQSTMHLLNTKKDHDPRSTGSEKAGTTRASESQSTGAALPTGALRQQGERRKKDVKGIPPELEALWKRIVDRKSLAAAVSDLRKDLVEVAGLDRGETIYREILASAGVQRVEQFSSLGPARQTASALWKAIQDVANEPPNPPEGDDDAFAEGASPIRTPMHLDR